MKNPAALLLGFCLLAPTLLAVAPRPSVLKVRYGGEMLPVVRVHHDDPYVMVVGKEVLVRSDPVYVLDRASGYSSNFVEAPRGGLGGKFQFQLIGANTYDVSALNQGDIEVPMELKAWKTIKGGYAVVVMFSGLNQAEILVRELPELPAEKAVKFKMTVHALPRTITPMYFIQIFDDTGREVRTNDLSYAWQYYAARDRARLAAAITKYQAKYPTADHEAVPFLMVGPVFRAGAVLPTGEITVTLSVGADGTVTDVDAGMIGNDSARNSVIEALGGWLFLPKLTAGQPEFTTVSVPLRF